MPVTSLIVSYHVLANRAFSSPLLSAIFDNVTCLRQSCWPCPLLQIGGSRLDPRCAVGMNRLIDEELGEVEPMALGDWRWTAGHHDVRTRVSGEHTKPFQTVPQSAPAVGLPRRPATTAQSSSLHLPRTRTRLSYPKPAPFFFLHLLLYHAEGASTAILDISIRIRPFKLPR